MDKNEPKTWVWETLESPDVRDIAPGKDISEMDSECFQVFLFDAVGRRAVAVADTVGIRVLVMNTVVADRVVVGVVGVDALVDVDCDGCEACGGEVDFLVIGDGSDGALGGKEECKG